MKFVKVSITKIDPTPVWMLQIDRGSRNFAKSVAFAQLQSYLRNPHAQKDPMSPHRMSAFSKLTLAIDMHQRDGWFMNSVGGMCPNVVNVLETKEADAFPVEELTVKISQWGNGTHYYARLNNGMDVELDGVGKWDTWEEAQAAADKVIANLNKST